MSESYDTRPRRDRALLRASGYGTVQRQECAGGGASAMKEALLAAARSAEGDRDYYISYAWGDDTTPEGIARENAVEGLAEAARRQNIKIHRDKERLKFGDLISEFMECLSGGDRVFIFISGKYLASFNCMIELTEVWRKCGQDKRKFLQQTRPFILPCARIWTPADRAEHAVYWRNRFLQVEDMIREHGTSVVGKLGNEQHQKTRQIADSVADLLTLITDTLQASNFDDFVKYGFGDLLSEQS